MLILAFVGTAILTSIGVSILNYLGDTAYDDYERAEELLEEWLSVRPLLHVSQCPYARSLVRQMIAAHLRVILYDHIDGQKHLDYLYSLLEDPPDGGPVPGITKSSGHLFYE